MKTADADLPEHVTTPLLTLITQQSLDVDYQHVADRRAANGEPTRTAVRPGTALVVALFGLLLVVAAIQTSRNTGADEQNRASLIAQINAKKETVADQERRAEDLRRDLTAAEDELDSLSTSTQASLAEAQRLQVPTGFTAVHGPGVRVIVDDGPGGDTGRVRDEDLAMLADGLWSAGAEAISINGHRLTVLSPIRTSGAAIYVAERPISPPYTILAIGDTSTLQSRFAETTHGLAFYSLVTTLGFDFDMQNVEDLSLPGARMPVLRWADVPRPDDEDLLHGPEVTPSTDAPGAQKSSPAPSSEAPSSEGATP